MKFPFGADELQRLEAVRQSGLLDTAPEQVFDDLVTLAAQICQTPIALITLVDRDRNWFKSFLGISGTEMPRDQAFCAHTILHTDGILEIPDTSIDPRFSSNPFVTGKPAVRFYAGIPLTTREGHALGALCVLDIRARKLTPEQIDALRKLRNSIITEIELRALTCRLEERVQSRTHDLEAANERLCEELGARAKAEAALQDSERQFRLLIQHAPVALAMFNREMCYLAVSGQWLKDFTLQDRDLLGRSHYEFFPDLPERWKLAHQRGLAGEVVRRDRDCYTPPDGMTRWIRWEVHPWHGSDGTVCGIVIFVENLTGHFRAEAARQQLLTALLQAESEERRRIARELHDSTAQHLAAAKMSIARVQHSSQSSPMLETESLAECLSLIEQAMQEIRTFSWLLHPPLLDELGLAGALRDYTAGFTKRSGILVKMDVEHFNGRLSHETELTLFRVVQESLTNVQRHSGGSAVLIRLERDESEVRLEVQDNGHGLASGARDSAGVGFNGMQERLRQLCGELHIDSDAEGTTILASVPLNFTVNAV